jgi:DHA1 family multidrug resistance protein-like MFS transporter
LRKSYKLEEKVRNLLLPKAANKGVFFVAVSQLGIAFSFNFIMAFLPFYILKVSDFGPQETMIWIGTIMGASSVTAALAAPLWGKLTSRFRSKMLYEIGILCNGMICLLMGFTGNLYLLLLLRIILGALGAISTIGLVLISSLSTGENLHKNMSLYQNAMTAGQLISPALGAYTVTLFGYRSAFVFAAAVVFIFFAFCRRYVDDIPLQKEDAHERGPIGNGVLWGWVLSFVATVHLTFLPSILPHMLENFQVVGEPAVKTAGIIMMAYTATAILGNYLVGTLISREYLKRAVIYASLSAAFFQLLMAFSGGVFSFTLIRMIQTGAIAAVFPVIISIFAPGAGGGRLGFLNSSRFAGNAIAPLMATSVLAYSNFFVLSVMIAGITLASLWAFAASTRTFKSG